MRRRLRLAVEGAVQGVGFRPFVYRLAHELGLAGWVANDPRGVRIEVEGEEWALRTFRGRLDRGEAGATSPWSPRSSACAPWRP